MKDHHTRQPDPNHAFTQPVLDALRAELTGAPRLSDVAHVVAGASLAHTTPAVAGIKAYTLDTAVYRTAAQSGAGVEPSDAAWPARKLVVHLATQQPNPWKVTAAVDERDAVWLAPLLIAWPRNEYPLEALAGVLNGPIASTWIGHAPSVSTLEQLPLPRFSAATLAATIDLVQQFDEVRRRAAHNTAEVDLLRKVVLQIDAEVLAAYDLPPRLERDLLLLFSDWQRPIDVPFDRFYPTGFQPALPLWRVIPSAFQETRADATVVRLPVLHDAAISAMVAELDRG